MTARIESALSFIPADDRETWVAMAMAIKSEAGDAGFEIWDEWSRTASNYNAGAAQAVWRSCRGRGVTVGTLFHEAKAQGWRDDDKAAFFAYPRRQHAEENRTGDSPERHDGKDALRLLQREAETAVSNGCGQRGAHKSAEHEVVAVKKVHHQNSSESDKTLYRASVFSQKDYLRIAILYFFSHLNYLLSADMLVP